MIYLVELLGFVKDNFTRRTRFPLLFLFRAPIGAYSTSKLKQISLISNFNTRYKDDTTMRIKRRGAESATMTKRNFCGFQLEMPMS